MKNQVVTKEQMKMIESYAIESYGIPDVALMENAALKVMKNIDLVNRETFAIICGTGNNGADGLVIARNLLALDKTVYVFLLGDINKGSRLFDLNLKVLEKMEANIQNLETIGDFEDFEKNLGRVNTIIDAITGIGFEGAFQGVYDFVIDVINRSRIYTISVDMPSGMEANTGYVPTVCIIPDIVVTFQIMKKGLLETNRLLNTKIIVEPIGIPIQAVNRVIAQRPNF